MRGTRQQAAAALKLTSYGFARLGGLGAAVWRELSLDAPRLARRKRAVDMGSAGIGRRQQLREHGQVDIAAGYHRGDVAAAVLAG